MPGTSCAQGIDRAHVPNAQLPKDHEPPRRGCDDHDQHRTIPHMLKKPAKVKLSDVKKLEATEKAGKRK